MVNRRGEAADFEKERKSECEESLIKINAKRKRLF